jgi:hypothetical protein
MQRVIEGGIFIDISQKGSESMRAKDPKQAVINTLTNSNPQMKREERGILAEPESILFLKEKNHQYVHAYVVCYTSTTNQQWYDTSYVIQNTDGSFTRRCGVYCKAEDRFLADKEAQVIHQFSPQLRLSTGGGKPIIQTSAQKESMRGTLVQETIEGNVTKHTLRIGSSSIYYEPAGDVSDYRFLVGNLTANGQEVASVRMIPRVGSVEEDKVQDNTVLFLSEYSLPITFEFYSPSHTLIATQFWNI